MRFTIRDWLWACVVLSLAFGWGSHFRYTRYKDTPVTYKLPTDTSELQQALARMKENKQEEETKYRAITKALHETSVTIVQRQELDQKVKEILAVEAQRLPPDQKERMEDQLHSALFTPGEIREMDPDWYEKAINRMLKKSGKSQPKLQEAGNSD